jgi:DNA-binding NarL/FixJ family response regulator
MKAIKILLAEDHTLVREGIRVMLKLQPDFEVVGEAQDGRKAVTMAIELCPDVILMDIAMPGMNGLEATRQVLKARPETKVVILTAHCDDAYVQSAADSGAVGFLLKQDSACDVCRAIREVRKGIKFYSSSIVRRVKRINPQSLDRTGNAGKNSSLLTSREMEVLQLIAEGKANKQTASDLGISIKTVEKHRGNLMQKLDIHDTAGLTRHAIATGVIESSVQITML